LRTAGRFKEQHRHPWHDPWFQALFNNTTGILSHRFSSTQKQHNRNFTKLTVFKRPFNTTGFDTAMVGERSFTTPPAIQQCHKAKRSTAIQPASGTKPTV
jgi:hypothetical protein